MIIIIVFNWWRNNLLFGKITVKFLLLFTLQPSPRKRFKSLKYTKVYSGRSIVQSTSLKAFCCLWPFFGQTWSLFVGILRSTNRLYSVTYYIDKVALESVCLPWVRHMCSCVCVCGLSLVAKRFSICFPLHVFQCYTSCKLKRKSSEDPLFKVKYWTTFNSSKMYILKYVWCLSPKG